MKKGKEKKLHNAVADFIKLRQMPYVHCWTEFKAHLRFKRVLEIGLDL